MAFERQRFYSPPRVARTVPTASDHIYVYTSIYLYTGAMNDYDCKNSPSPTTLHAERITTSYQWGYPRVSPRHFFTDDFLIYIYTYIYIYMYIHLYICIPEQ
jgi:hypothetical protein